MTGRQTIASTTATLCIAAMTLSSATAFAKSRFKSRTVKLRAGQAKRAGKLRVKLQLTGKGHRPGVGKIANYTLTWRQGTKKDEAHLTSDHMCMEHRSFGMLVQAAGLRGGERASKLSVSLLPPAPRAMIGEDKAQDIAYAAARRRRHPTSSSALTEANGCYAIIFRGLESKTEMEVQVGGHTGKVLDVLVRKRR